MEKFIGIIIPPESKAKMVDFCTKYNSKLIEPYMCIIPHEMLVSVRGFDRKLQSFCLSQPPVKTLVGGPNIENTQDGRVLFLTVMMGALNVTRDKLLNHLKTPPSSGVFRTQIVLVTEREVSEYDFDSMLEEAKKVFSKPKNILVRELAIYSRKEQNDFFTIQSSYPFTGR